MTWSSIADDALGAVLDHAPGGFAEAHHTMAFPRDQGFAAGADEQTGDTFARALIADALCDLRARDPDAVAPLLDREAEHLLARRDRTGARAWRYFPGLLELPADLDDLAQVMQVLLRTGRRAAVAAACDGPIALALESGLDTWIVPRTADDEDLDRQRWWIANAWGAGADPEVVANFLYALHLYDPVRHAPALDAGARWLTDRQEPGGWWRATWYHGPFYGTWAATRALHALDPEAHAPALHRAAAAIAGLQRHNGSWGPAPDGDALSTALALLTLALLRPDPEGHARAREYLTPLAAAPAADPLVRMELGRPTGRPWAVLSYGSAAVTAALVAKAATAYVNV
jgi:squalene-hopene/tetraprenyl-beta-curcumene cyclase